MLLGYIVVGVVSLIVGGLAVWVYPRRKRVRMEITLEEIIKRTFVWTGHKRFEWMAVNKETGKEESGITWAESSQAVWHVLRRTHDVIYVEETDRMPVKDTDRIVLM